MSGRPKRAPIDEDADALRLLVREAHEATQDLKATIREAQTTREQLMTMAAVAITESVDVAVSEGLAAYSAAIAKAIEEATDAVYKRFDVIADTLLGETESQKRRGMVPMVDQAALVRKIVRGATPDDLTPEELEAIHTMQTNQRKRSSQ